VALKDIKEFVSRLKEIIQDFNMGEPKKRVSPRIANQVNRDFKRLLCILGAVRATPWECNSIGRPYWDPRIVAVCVFMKIFLCKTYDGTLGR